MKNIVIVLAVIVGGIFYFYNRDTFSDEIYWSGEIFKLGKDTGKKGVMKTYQYTQSGTISGLNDYVQIFVVENTPENALHSRASKVRELMVNSYSLDKVEALGGEFGIFKVPGEPRDFYAYFIERDTAAAHWFLMYVIQSNFGNKQMHHDEAMGKADAMFSSLNDVFDQVYY